MSLGLVGSMRGLFCLAFLANAGGLLLAQDHAAFVPPRLKDGHPNLQGLWGRIGAFAPPPPGVGVERPSGSAGIDSIFASLEYLPAALPKKRELAAKRGNDLLFFWCATASVPTAMLYIPFPLMIVQDGSNVVFLHESAHDVRIVPVDGSPHPKHYSALSGDSRGRWEGDTLVVDVTNFSKGDRRMSMLGDFLDGNSHVIERYRLSDANTISYEATLEDPTVLAKPATVHTVLLRQGKDDRMLDTACREGERDSRFLDQVAGEK